MIEMTLQTKRPWGRFLQFTENEPTTVKILEIEPQQSISLQFHNKREELWYFLDKAKIQVDNMTLFMREGEQIRIKKGIEHRVFALDEKVRILEISSGIFEEDDEVRIEDKYNRT